MANDTQNGKTKQDRSETFPRTGSIIVFRPQPLHILVGRAQYKTFKTEEPRKLNAIASNNNIFNQIYLKISATKQASIPWKTGTT